MTVAMPVSMLRPLREVSSRFSDSGVVIRISGGLRIILRRSSPGVSPLRVRTVIDGKGVACAVEGLPQFRKRLQQVSLDVVVQCFERRDVEHADRAAGPGPVDKLVQGPQERGQRLAAARGRGNEHMPALADLGPGLFLDVGRLADLFPRTTCWMRG